MFDWDTKQVRESFTKKIWQFTQNFLKNHHKEQKQKKNKITGTAFLV